MDSLETLPSNPLHRLLTALSFQLQPLIATKLLYLSAESPF